MNARLAYLFDRLRESFWILPTLISVAAGLLAVATHALDRSELPVAMLQALPISLTVENARPILSTVAGSMITVASLVFSLTLVALTLAAQQLGPRLLPLFVRDRLTQVVFGMLLGGFVFALLSLAILGGKNSSSTQATTTVTAAVALALTGFTLLVVFIHHLAQSIQADVVVARMAELLIGQIEGRPQRNDDAQVASAEEPALSAPGAREVPAPRGGYIQSIDYPELVRLAERHETVIRVPFRPGHFVCMAESLAVVDDADDSIDEALCSAIVMGIKRTGADDIEFALQAIVEVALRALSPGVNDPFTAMTCIDRIGDAVSRLFDRELPPPVHHDDQQRIRVVTATVTMAGILDSAFDQIRQAGSRDVAILIRLLETFTRLVPYARTGEQLSLIEEHAQMVLGAGERKVHEPADVEDLQSRMSTFQEAMGDAGRSSLPGA